MPSTRRRRRSTVESDDLRQSSRRRSARGQSSLSELAKDIRLYRRRVLFITGAGMSVASGVRPFRGKGGVWTQHIWQTGTREAFRKDPLEWYNEFWLPCLTLPKNAGPNIGHFALAEVLRAHPNTKMITQNVDGFSPPSNQTIEAHGRLGLYKCIPAEDSDTDSDSDDDDDRLVHLGHRRKRRLAAKKKNKCPFQLQESLDVDQIEPAATRDSLKAGRAVKEAPKCPSCSNPMAPQALLFDEGYHSHDFYQFQKMEKWLAEAEVIVFVGTSFQVRLPEIALEHARAKGIPVYNFNPSDMLEPTAILNATNISGKSEETLPLLLEACANCENFHLELDTRRRPKAARNNPQSPSTVRVRS